MIPRYTRDACGGFLTGSLTSYLTHVRDGVRNDNFKLGHYHNLESTDQVYSQLCLRKAQCQTIY